MVFVIKSVDMMISEIGDNSDEFSDNIITKNWGANWVSHYLSRHDELISQNVSYPNRKITKSHLQDEERKFYGLAYLLENCFNRAYDFEKEKPIQIKHYFGKQGLIYSVQDWGKGFDSHKLIIAAKKNRLRRGKHYQNKCMATKFMIKPLLESSIESSTIEPTGTTVTIMYKYQST